jgi:Uncharacterized protein conserved in bacteria
MSFLDALKTGDIPEKKRKKGETRYDEYMRLKKLKTGPEEKSVEIIKPLSFGDVEKLIDLLKAGQGVIADLSAATPSDAQRMLDFLSGAVYALDGKIERVENKMFLMTPKGLNIVNKI